MENRIELTEEMVKNAEISEKTIKIVHNSKKAIAITSTLGASIIVDRITSSIAANETNILRKAVIKLGGLVMDAAIGKSINDILDGAEVFTIGTIKAFKAYQKAKKEIEDNGSYTEPEAE